jgi:hypothetical protein
MMINEEKPLWTGIELVCMYRAGFDCLKIGFGSGQDKNISF